MDCYEENKITDILCENVHDENIAVTFCKFCDKVSTLQNDDCCGNKVHEGKNYMTPVKDNSVHGGKYFVNPVKMANKKIQDLPKLVMIVNGNVIKIDANTSEDPKNDPLGGEKILPKIEKSEEEDFESKTILVPNVLNMIHEDHNYISGPSLRSIAKEQ